MLRTGKDRGTVRLNPADGKHLVAVVEHVADDLHDFPDLLDLPAGPVHAHAEDFHADVASFHLIRSQNRDSAPAVRFMPFTTN